MKIFYLIRALPPAPSPTAWLFKWLSGPPCVAREWALVASASLTSNITCMTAFKEAGGVDLFCLLLHSPSLLEVELAAAALCNFTAELDPAVEGRALRVYFHASFRLTSFGCSHNFTSKGCRKVVVPCARGEYELNCN
jgi:hypothetical protein